MYTLLPHYPILSRARIAHMLREIETLPRPSGGSGSYMSDRVLTKPVVGPYLSFLEPYSCTVIFLYASQQIPLHCDAPISGTRFHIPLQSNDGCWSLHDGLWQQLEVGRIYEMDPTLPHGAVNWGAE